MRSLLAIATWQTTTCHAFALQRRLCIAIVDKGGAVRLLGAKDPVALDESDFILAIDVHVDAKTCCLFCAVATQLKICALYKIDLNSSTSQTLLVPRYTFVLPKKAASLRILPVPATTEFPLLMVTGDKIGEVRAYSLLNFSSSSTTTTTTTTTTKTTSSVSVSDSVSVSTPPSTLLLGHTASMITSVEFTPNHKFILSSDRDEKIRVSHFPDTQNVQSYLLGHTSFITCTAVSNDICATSSADNSVRVFDIESGSEHAIHQTDTDGTPTHLAISPSGKTIAYILDGVKKVNVLSYEDKTLTVIASLPTTSQPLNFQFTSDTSFFALATEPAYMLSFSISEDLKTVTQLSSDSSLVVEVANHAKQHNVTMPKLLIDGEDSNSFGNGNENGTTKDSLTKMKVVHNTEWNLKSNKKGKNKRPRSGKKDDIVPSE